MTIEQRPETARDEHNHNTLPTTEAALLYAQSGWPVFPLHGKIPFKNSHGHLDATTDLDQLRQWWNAHPAANIGLATGEVSGVIVVDMDPKHGGYESFKHLQAAHEMLPPTRTSRTAHGGLHLYFQHPGDGEYPNSAGVLGLGLDTRGDG